MHPNAEKKPTKQNKKAPKIFRLACENVGIEFNGEIYRIYRICIYTTSLNLPTL